jgi:hypothetical protein
MQFKVSAFVNCVSTPSSSVIVGGVVHLTVKDVNLLHLTIADSPNVFMVDGRSKAVSFNGEKKLYGASPFTVSVFSPTDMVFGIVNDLILVLFSNHITQAVFSLRIV